MPPKFERSSAPELFVRCYREAKTLARWVLALSACSPIEAEVGSGLPPTADAHPPDAPAATRCDAFAPLGLYYRNGHVADSSNSIDYLVKVENRSGAALVPDSLKIRYYFTNELAPPWAISVFYTDICCSNKITNFNSEILTSVQPLPATAGADAFLEIAFASSLAPVPAGDAIQVEVGFHDPAYARNVNQTNDYSYVTAATATQTEWDSCPGPQCDPRFTSCSMTLYRDDVLVWGVLP
jgi:cellulose binding protein with CBM3 domain